MFSAGTEDVSPFTSPGNSRVGAEEPKPPVSETPSRTISKRSDSLAVVTNPTDDPAAFEHAQKQGRVSSPLPRDPDPLQLDYDKNQHDPTISDTPHVDLILEPAQGVPRSSPPRPDPSRGIPSLAKILTNMQLESKDSGSSGTAFYTPGQSGEVVDRRPFDSAVNIQIEPSSCSQAVGGPTRGVVDPHKPVNKWKSKYQFPTQAPPSPRSGSKTTDDAPRHGLRMSLTRPSHVRERGGDSTISFTSSPFDEFQKDASPFRRISEANVHTIPGRESGPRPKSKLSAGSGGSDAQGNNMFPRQKGKRMVPRWKGSEGRSEEGRSGRGKEGDDRSSFSNSADYVSVPSGDAEGRSWNQNPTQVSSTRSWMRYTT